MTKLKKLFPLSFKFCKSPVSIILGALINAAIAAACSFIISSIFNAILTPFMLLGLIPIIGWFIILPIASFLSSVISGTVSTFFTAYAFAAIGVAIAAYAKSEDETAA